METPQVEYEQLIVEASRLSDIDEALRAVALQEKECEKEDDEEVIRFPAPDSEHITNQAFVSKPERLPSTYGSNVPPVGAETVGMNIRSLDAPIG